MGRLIEMKGKKLGKLTVLGKSKISKNKEAAWDCQCECGRIKQIHGTSLRNGRVKSCGNTGCRGRFDADMVGRRFGKLLVLCKAETTLGGENAWVCQCACGSSTEIRGGCLRRGDSKSCGNIGCRGKFDDEMLGRKFGRLTVISRYDKLMGSEYGWLCRCECGSLLPVRGYSLRKGNTKTCGRGEDGCRRTEKSKNKPLGHLNSLLHGIRRRAKNRGIKLDIDLEHLWQLWVQQDTRCAITNFPMTTTKGKGHCWSNASVDRIDSTGGYEIGNVQLLCFGINRMKSDYNAGSFVFYCHIVASHNPMSGDFVQMLDEL